MESRKMALMNLVENGLVDTVGAGEGGANWESSNDTYTLPWVRYLVGTCYRAQGASLALCDVSEESAGGGQGGASGRGTYTHI